MSCSPDSLQFPCQSGQPDICNNKDEAVQSTGTCDESSDSSENDQVAHELDAEMKFRPDEFEVDPQTCWPCVGCQDEGVPKTIRWCSVM